MTNKSKERIFKTVLRMSYLALGLASESTLDKERLKEIVEDMLPKCVLFIALELDISEEEATGMVEDVIGQVDSFRMEGIA
jgi:hypothetical protein